MANYIKEQYSPLELVNNFNEILTLANNDFTNVSLLAKVNDIAEIIIGITSKMYDETYNEYRNVRGFEIEGINKKGWIILEKYIDECISSNKTNVKILDVGASHGRDVIYAQTLGYEAIGVDNCEGFIKILSNLCSMGKLKPNSYKKCEMRNLDFSDSTFDVVRHNATLLHMPLIGLGYTVDQAVSEAFRVLKRNGLLYILIKSKLNSALEVHDTEEGLGGRIFQYFSRDTITDVLVRNGFVVVFASDEVTTRGHIVIDWIILIAQKNR